MKKYLKTCRTCGETFITADPTERVCSNCKQQSREQSLKRLAEERKALRRKRKPKTDIYKCPKLVDEYNSEHGTKYSYGQLESLIHIGYIKYDKW